MSHQTSTSFDFNCDCEECRGLLFRMGRRVEEDEEIIVLSSDDDDDEMDASYESISPPSTPEHAPSFYSNDEDADEDSSETTEEAVPDETEHSGNAVAEPESHPTCRRSSRLSAKVNNRKPDASQIDQSSEEPELSHLPSTSASTSRNRPLPPANTASAHPSNQSNSGTYPCTFSDCSKVFQSKASLRFHLYIHSGKFTCSDCGKPCQSNSSLVRHQRVHTGEAPFSCTQCSKSFKERNKLKVHQRIHSGSKPYQCSHCSHQFSVKNDLTRHLRLHTGQLPFQCIHCAKKFNQKYRLTRHLQNKH